MRDAVHGRPSSPRRPQRPSPRRSRLDLPGRGNAISPQNEPGLGGLLEPDATRCKSFCARCLHGFRIQAGPSPGGPEVTTTAAGWTSSYEGRTATFHQANIFWPVGRLGGVPSSCTIGVSASRYGPGSNDGNAASKRSAGWGAKLHDFDHGRRLVRRLGVRFRLDDSLLHLGGGHPGDQ